jgi:hypothetical protein
MHLFSQKNPPSRQKQNSGSPGGFAFTRARPAPAMGFLVQSVAGGRREIRAEHLGGSARNIWRDLVSAGTEYVPRSQFHERTDTVVDQRRDRVCAGRDCADLGEPSRKTSRVIISPRPASWLRVPRRQFRSRRLRLSLRRSGFPLQNRSRSFPRASGPFCPGRISCRSRPTRSPKER